MPEAGHVTPYPFGVEGTCLLCPGTECSPGTHARYADLERNYQEHQVTDRHEFERSQRRDSAHKTNSHPDCRACRAALIP